MDYMGNITSLNNPGALAKAGIAAGGADLGDIKNLYNAGMQTAGGEVGDYMGNITSLNNPGALAKAGIAAGGADLGDIKNLYNDVDNSGVNKGAMARYKDYQSTTPGSIPDNIPASKVSTPPPSYNSGTGLMNIDSDPANKVPFDIRNPAAPPTLSVATRHADDVNHIYPDWSNPLRRPAAPPTLSVAAGHSDDVNYIYPDWSNPLRRPAAPPTMYDKYGQPVVDYTKNLYNQVSGDVAKGADNVSKAYTGTPETPGGIKPALDAVWDSVQNTWVHAGTGERILMGAAGAAAGLGLYKGISGAVGYMAKLLGISGSGCEGQLAQVMNSHASQSASCAQIADPSQRAQCNQRVNSVVSAQMRDMSKNCK